MKLHFIKSHFIHFKQVMTMAGMDLKKMYSGSFLGFLWIIIRHLIVVLVFWFTFAVGLRGNKLLNGYSYFIWLIVGLTPWFFIAESLNSGAQALIKKAYIIKKIFYHNELFPAINTVTNLFSHLIFLAIVLILLAFNGYLPTLYSFLLFYYMFAAFMFMWFVTLLTSSLAVLIRDIPYLVQSITSALLWLSPILWPIENLPEPLRQVMRFNPLYYLVNGYRNALLYHDLKLVLSVDTVVYWGIVLLISILSIRVFKKLRPFISDML